MHLPVHASRENPWPSLAGALAPHPPHLVYAENTPQNEPAAECGWENLRWGYERLRRTIERLDIDVIVVHSPHWKTRQGHHVLGVPHFRSLSVDPIFPHLFRYHYDLRVDVELAEAIAEEGEESGLAMQVMRNPDFRVDYGTITSCHLSRPTWDLPIVSISSSRVYFDYNNDVGDRQMVALGRATRRAIERAGEPCCWPATPCRTGTLRKSPTFRKTCRPSTSTTTASTSGTCTCSTSCGAGERAS